MASRQVSASRGWFVFSVIAALAVVGVLAFAEQSVRYSPILMKRAALPSPLPEEVNANRCSADSVCEVTSLQVGAPDVGGLVAHGNTLTTNSRGRRDLVLTSSSGKVRIAGDLELLGDFAVRNSDAIDCKVFNYRSVPGNSTDGDSFCQTVGFDYCLVGEYQEGTTYFESRNGTCSGRVQAKFTSRFVGDCPSNSGGSGGGCFSIGPSMAAEPYLGDVATGVDYTRNVRVVCCR
ncbi:hypothetical protein D6817_03375 [Candidatus Pacearchaeota archaeon]|nr:MAG: hypothetical protein D6817_03375 [Candidatus Pacearchaeota archaeon]